MPAIAVTGHMNLTERTVDLVRSAMTELLEKYPPDQLVGMSCLARGADSIFAEAVLDAGGTLVAVLPSHDYCEKKVKPDHAPLFDRLLKDARVEVMPFDTANRDAYEAANNYLLDNATELFAVWDGQPPTGKGSTADVVAEAHERGLPITVVWPNGAARA